MRLGAPSADYDGAAESLLPSRWYDATGTVLYDTLTEGTTPSRVVSAYDVAKKGEWQKVCEIASMRTFSLAAKHRKCPALTSDDTLAVENPRLFQPEDKDGVIATSLLECQQKCISTPGCQYFTHMASMQWCTGCALKKLQKAGDFITYRFAGDARLVHGVSRSKTGRSHHRNCGHNDVRGDRA